MKNYSKGLLSGFLIAILVFCLCSVYAENIQVLFNTVRISFNGIDKVQWGESYTLDNGNTVPYSIVYGGTTYLPMRKMGELYGKAIYWNGDSQTAYTTEPQNPDTFNSGEPTYKIAEKADENGNVWTYYIFRTEKDEKYLGVKDKQRGYERIYRISGGGMSNQGQMSNKYNRNFAYVTDNAIIFSRKSDIYLGSDLSGAYLWKINFRNGMDTQDGEKLLGYVDVEDGIGQTLFCGDYLFCIDSSKHLYACNMITGERIEYDATVFVGGIESLNITNVNSLHDPGDKPIVLRCEYRGSSGTQFFKNITFYHDDKMRFEP